MSLNSNCGGEFKGIKWVLSSDIAPYEGDTMTKAQGLIPLMELDRGDINVTLPSGKKTKNGILKTGGFLGQKIYFKSRNWFLI